MHDWEPKSVSEILSDLRIRVYEEPLLSLRSTLGELPEVIQVILLITDFETEIIMQGILGFLENSTGEYLPDTIEAFRRIGDQKTVAILMNIVSIMNNHAVTWNDLRQDFQSIELYRITSFSELHGHELNPMAEAIEAKADELYLYHAENERVSVLFESYVSPHLHELIGLLMINRIE